MVDLELDDRPISSHWLPAVRDSNISDAEIHCDIHIYDNLRQSDDVAGTTAGAFWLLIFSSLLNFKGRHFC